MPEIFDATKLEADHLLILAGGNPLPNYVAAPLLVKDGGHITVMYTAATQKRIDRDFIPALRDRLNSRATVSKHSAAMDDSRQSSIFAQVKKAIEAKPTLNGVIGLHYTAGTKAMAVHAYRAIEQLAAGKNGFQTRFTYLNARELCIIADSPTGDPEDFLNIANVQVKLQDLLKIHGGKPVNKPSTTPIMPLASRETAGINYDRKMATQLRAWTNSDKSGWKDKVEEAYKKIENDVKRVNRNAGYKHRLALINDRLSSRPTISLKGCPLNVEYALKEDLQQTTGEIDLVQAVKDGYLPSVASFYAWANGTWLESYSMWALQEASITGCHNMHSFSLSTEVEFKDGPDIFEMDVLAIRGYQLFAISCAIETSLNEGEGRAKWKLFEAITRARQIGGDEARVAFVSLLMPAAALNLVQEAARPLSSQDNVRAFGRSDLEHLPTLFSDWVNKP